MKPLFFILMLTVIACNTAPKEDTENEPKVENVSIDAGAVESNLPQCYVFIAQKDTYALKLAFTDEAVKGTAVYKNHEKDSSHGDVEGAISGDIIHLWYSFNSEGMKSVRELFFKRTGEGLVTGVAEEQTKADSAFVADKDAVRYEGPTYKPADCNLVPVL
ncbi:hypothetical protein ABDK00_001405 [Niabella insulamsoli]|uniref:hypothetical protein n=1 Tax=Niabella insulamsoli TaxID=3144874 RepID=UPI0031FD53C2